MNIEECLKYFSKRFEFAMKQKNDRRSYSINNINNSNSNIFSEIRFCFWCQNHDENNILIYYDPEKISQEYLSLNLNNENLKLVFNYLAMHEYGHTYMSQTPNEIQEFTSEEKKSIENILYFDYYAIENPFREFFADYIGSTIDNTIPLPFINKRFEWIREKLSFHKYRMFPMTNFRNINTKRELKFYYYLKDMGFLYIFNSWNLLEHEFHNTNNSGIIKFFKLVFELFKRISITHSRFRNTRKNIIRLVYLLDQFVYDDLIRNNFLTEPIISNLQNFEILFE